MKQTFYIFREISLGLFISYEKCTNKNIYRGKVIFRYVDKVNIFMSEYGHGCKDLSNVTFCSLYIFLIYFMFILIQSFPHGLKPLITYLAKRINWNCSSSPTLTHFLYAFEGCIEYPRIIQIGVIYLMKISIFFGENTTLPNICFRTTFFYSLFYFSVFRGFGKSFSFTKI